MTEDAGRISTNTPDRAWRRALAAIGDDEGYYEPLGPAHSVLLSRRGPVLLVTFESIGEILACSTPPAALPLGYSIARDGDHSSLTVICDGDTWFRDPAVYAYFDRLTDEGFFEDFDRVVFYGNGACGYAAAAYSVAAPGATVVAIQPQATLSPDLAGWDDRFTAMRRTCFTDRYGFAPEMLDAAAEAFVIYDPLERLDAMHAALLMRDATVALPCLALGGKIERSLADMHILPGLIRAACNGELTAARFYKALRQRRSNGAYTRNLARQLEARGHVDLVALLCQHVLAHRRHAPWFSARLKEIRKTRAVAEAPAAPAAAPPRDESPEDQGPTALSA